MGLTVSFAINLIECTKEIKKERVLCLGEQCFGFSVKDLINSRKKYNHNVDFDKFNYLDPNQELNQKLFFTTLGFKEIDTLDVNDYEGANIIFDLNQNNTPKELISKYDLIYDGGTLQHVCNIGNALKHLTKMTNKNGVIFHSNPCNGYIDHGFFQISPTLYFDYYLTNKFKVIYSGIIEQSIGRRVYPVRQELYHTLDGDFGPKNTPKGVLIFCAKKLIDNNEIEIPQQGYYNSVWNNENLDLYIVEKHIPLSNYRVLQTIFSLWIKLPYKLIYLLKSIKKVLK